MVNEAAASEKFQDLDFSLIPLKRERNLEFVWMLSQGLALAGVWNREWEGKQTNDEN